MPHGKYIKYKIISGVSNIVSDEVFLLEETHDKIATNHPDVDIERIIKTVETPDTICKGNMPNTVVFINNTYVNRHAHPLLVPVKNFVDKPSIITTAYYSSSKISREPVWVKGEESTNYEQ